MAEPLRNVLSNYYISLNINAYNVPILDCDLECCKSNCTWLLSFTSFFGNCLLSGLCVAESSSISTTSLLRQDGQGAVSGSSKI